MRTVKFILFRLYRNITHCASHVSGIHCLSLSLILVVNCHQGLSHVFVSGYAFPNTTCSFLFLQAIKAAPAVATVVTKDFIFHDVGFIP